MNKEEWKKVRLGELCKTTSGGTPTSKNTAFYEGGTIPWIKSGELKEKYIYQAEQKITELGVEKSTAKFIPENSVLIAMYGATVGQVSILKINATTNQAVCSILPTEELIPEFLYYSLTAKKEELLKLAVGGAQPNISQQIIKNIPLPLPPLSIQREIVSELDLLSTIITKKRAQLAELDRLAAATFHQTFGDPIENPKQWPTKKLGEVCEVGSSKRVFVNDLQEKGIPFYRGTEIGLLGEGKEISPELFITPEHYADLKEFTGIPKKGDLLLPSICQDGRIWVVNTNEPFYFKDGRVLWIRLNHEVLAGQYLRFYLKAKFAEDYDKIASGTTFKELKIFALQGLPVILPPLSLQQTFASKIEAIEKQKELIKKSVAEVQTLLDATMDKWFS